MSLLRRLTSPRCSLKILLTASLMLSWSTAQGQAPSDQPPALPSIAQTPAQATPETLPAITPQAQSPAAPAAASTPASSLPMPATFSTPAAAPAGVTPRETLKSPALPIDQTLPPAPTPVPAPAMSSGGVASQEAMEITSLANSIRTHASFDLSGTLQFHGTPEFQVAWKNKIMPYFAGQEAQWQDFFSYAVIFGGRFSGLQSVIIFYNPWSDVALIVGMNSQTRQMTEFFVLPGERLRGQTIDTRTLLPAWQSEDEMLPYGVGRTYAETEKALNSLYPLNAPYALLPDALQSRVSSQADELPVVKARMVARTSMLQNISGPGRTQSDLAVITSALKANDRRAFETAMRDSNQDTRVTDLIFKWPALNRERLTVAYLMSRNDEMYAALINPSWPTWFVSVHFMKPSQGGELRASTVELFSYDVVKTLLKKQTGTAGQ